MFIAHRLSFPHGTMPHMHFLHVIQRYHPFVGGSESYFGELSEQFVRDGHQVTVLTTDAWDLDHFWAPNRRHILEPEAMHNGVRILRFPITRAPGPPIIYPILRRAMLELGRIPSSTPLLMRMAQWTPRVPDMVRYLQTTNEHFDLVHTTNITLDFTIIPALQFAQRRGIPHLCTPFVHLGEPGNQKIVRYYSQRHHLHILRQSKRVVVQTELERRFLEQRGIPSEKLCTVGCWVRPETLEGGDGPRFRQEHNLEGRIVLSIGAAAYDKGTMHLIAAMQRLWRKGSTTKLVLMCNTTLQQFEHYFEALPPQDKQRILLLRAAAHQTKLDALAVADVFALPSRTDSFGIVYLEAWIYNLPVIGARAGGVPDVIDHQQDGLLVSFGDVEALSDVIERLLRDRVLAQRFGERGRAKVLRELTFEHKYAAMSSVYEQVLGSKLAEACDQSV
jgi:glycosyltransferase involved in cell wall biosynthesis